MPRRAPSDCSFLCWGEVLWDLFPSGAKLGGSVANVAFHLGQLGARPYLVSRVGDDELGHRALAELGAAGVATELVQVDGRRCTGTVAVETVAGEPHYSLSSGGAWEFIELSGENEELLASVDTAIFGMLLGRNPHGRSEILRATNRVGDETRILIDANVRPVELDLPWLRSVLLRAHLVKLNEAEHTLLEAQLAGATPASWLFESGCCELFALTLGAAGCCLRTRNQEIIRPGIPAQAGGDNVGAGDAFVAVLALGNALSWPLSIIAERANRYASFVASRAGATPIAPPDLIEATAAPLPQT